MSIRPSILLAALLLADEVPAALPSERTTLPVVHIETDGREISDDGIVVRFGISDVAGGTEFTDSWNSWSGHADVNYHGSSSRGFDKKSYAIKLTDPAGVSTKAGLLGMSSDSKWILSAAFSDKTLLHNAFAYAMARTTGQYAPRTRLVELVLDGSYEGVYLLAERPQRSGNRIDVSKLDTTDLRGDSVTGGYVLRVDRASDGNGWTSTRDPYVYYQQIYPDIDEIRPEQSAYIRDWIRRFEDAMSSSSFSDSARGWGAWIEPGSFVDYLLVQELAKNVDGYRLSGYLHKRKDSKDGLLRAGPLWDCDLTFGMPDYYDGWKSAGWVYEWDAHAVGDGSAIPFWWRKLADDSAFRARIACRWTSLRAGSWSDAGWRGRLDSLVAVVRPAQERNWARWDVLGEQLWPEKYVPGTWQGEIDTMRSWIAARVRWMDGQLASRCVEPPAGTAPRADAARMRRDGNAVVWDAAPSRVRLETLDGRAIELRAAARVELPRLAAGMWLLSWKDAAGRWRTTGLIGS